MQQTNSGLIIPNLDDPTDRANLEAIYRWAQNSTVAKIIPGVGIGISSQTPARGPGASGTGLVTVKNTGVTQLLAGTGISLSPAGGTGNVTINATGGGGGLTGQAIVSTGGGAGVALTANVDNVIGTINAVLGTANAGFTSQINLAYAAITIIVGNANTFFNSVRLQAHTSGVWTDVDQVANMNVIANTKYRFSFAGVSDHLTALSPGWRLVVNPGPTATMSYENWAIFDWAAS